MRTRAARVRGIVSAVLLVAAGAALAWRCALAAVVAVAPPASSVVLRVAPDDPRALLARAAEALVRQHGQLDPSTLAQVRHAAAAAPLDANAFLVLGHQQLLDRQPDRALQTLAAGERLDPRNRVVHLLLLDRYLRTARYQAAATEMAVMARLIGGTGQPIANALAAMSLAPETRVAVRRTLDTDPRLETAVLGTLAAADVDPATIFAFASPRARASAANSGGWGEALVARLVERGREGEARAIWGRLYRVPDNATNPVFDGNFDAPAGPRPFGWSLTGNSLGVADIRNGTLAVDYYGRESGDLAVQLLVASPGPYRFEAVVDAGRTDAASPLFWSITCTAGGKAVLMDLPVVAAATSRRLAATLRVPDNCPAQRLTLRGEAGDLPAPSSVTLRRVGLRPAATAS